MIWTNLHPKARRHFQMLEEELMRGYMAGETKTLFKPFEGYRAPDKQRDMLERGTSKADAFQSAHQYGLAVDYVPWIAETPTRAGRWSWDDTLDWDYLDRAATRVGLHRPISWDRPHIEHPLWNVIKKFVV